MYKLTIPHTSAKGDATFFQGGIRLSSSFVEREKLINYKYVWIFIDSNISKIGLTFLNERYGDSVKLTNSSQYTKGKTISCAYLKQNGWINDVMMAENINNRKFTIAKIKEKSEKGHEIKYTIDLNENIDIPNLNENTDDIPF